MEKDGKRREIENGKISRRLERGGVKDVMRMKRSELGEMEKRGKGREVWG